MGISYETVKRNLSPDSRFEILPGEVIELFERSSSVKLFEAIIDGEYTECGGDIGGEFHNLTDNVNESIALITNHRIYYHPLGGISKSLSSSSLSSLADTTHPRRPRAVIIPHLSISQIEESQNQITITLNFSPLKYLFKFSKPKHNNHNKSPNSLCHDFSYYIKRFTNPNSIENVFAFRMGENEINNNQGKKRRELTDVEKLYQELFDTNINEEEDDDDAMRIGLDENTYKRIQKLGWSSGYKIQSEFKRMQMSKDCWTIVSYNDDFSLSPTYPKNFILPSPVLKRNQTFSCESFDENQVSSLFQSNYEFFRKLVDFRKNGRFPLICWKKHHHMLMRSGQPMVSILGRRGVEDELLIKDVVKTINEEQNQLIRNVNGGRRRTELKEKRTSTKFCILDARSYSAALGNGLARGGYENCENYPSNTTIHFLGLPNIHSISSSHTALLNAISTYSNSTKWFSVLESTGWLGHVADLLRAAGGKEGVVGKIIDEDSSILVHCTDGWDRTTQLVSLAQIMLDPFYRTIKGFQVLIEKEWIAYGHPFRARSDLPKNLRTNNNTIQPTGGCDSKQPISIPSVPAPVFLLFLTCVHHLLTQFPSAFEYNDFFLVCLARAAAGNSPYGDFLCNSEYEREYVRLRERTKSIWTWVMEHKPWFKNPGYRLKSSRSYNKYYNSSNNNNSNSSNNNNSNNSNNNNNNLLDNRWKNDVLRPDTEARLITLWNDYYFPKKSDLSITLLSTPPGQIPSFPTESVSSEFLLVNLLMKRRERRIAEKVWKVWRSFVLEKKGNSSMINRDDKDDVIVRTFGSEGESDELDIELIGSSVLEDSSLHLLPENSKKSDINNKTREKKNKNNPTDKRTKEKFFLVENFTQNELLAPKEDYFSEERSKSVHPGNLAELLEEAQSIEHHLCQCKYQDSKKNTGLTDSLKEAQFDNPLYSPSSMSQQRNSTQNISRTSSASPSRSCRSSIICTNNFTDNNRDYPNEINSMNSIENSSPDLDFVIV